jgi:hypothetical protein
MKKHILTAGLLLFFFLFVRAASAEDCITFNPDNCRVDWIQGSYKVVDGTMWLLDFGSNKDEAYKALEIIQNYRLNSQCFVGRPNAAMEYWLANGAAPAGSLSGEDCLSFDPANIQVSYVGGNYKIVDGNMWILDFGQKKAEAVEAYDLIKKYGFSEICYVGRPQPSMTYFKKSSVATPRLAVNPSIVKDLINLIKPAQGLSGEDCLSHNVDNLAVVNIGGSIRIVDGDHALLDFGNNWGDAKRSLDIIKSYRMDSHCFVGRPDPSFEYWLVAGAAPSGDIGGEDCLSFNPNTIEVKYISSRWKIVDGNQWMFDFNQNQTNAQKAFDVIKHYGFTKVCYVGRPDPKFIYLKK